MKHVKLYKDFLNEDWYDDLMNYAENVMLELQKRFVMNPTQKSHLIDNFLDKIENGFNKKIKPRKLAFDIVPKGTTITMWENLNELWFGSMMNGPAEDNEKNEDANTNKLDDRVKAGGYWVNKKSNQTWRLDWVDEEDDEVVMVKMAGKPLTKRISIKSLLKYWKAKRL